MRGQVTWKELLCSFQLQRKVWSTAADRKLHALMQVVQLSAGQQGDAMVCSCNSSRFDCLKFPGFQACIVLTGIAQQVEHTGSSWYCRHPPAHTQGPAGPAVQTLCSFICPASAALHKCFELHQCFGMQHGTHVWLHSGSVADMRATKHCQQPRQRLMCWLHKKDFSHQSHGDG